MRWAVVAMIAGILMAQEPKQYEARAAAQPLKIDGKLDEAAWAEAAWTDLFVDIEGDVKPKPRFKTRAKMTWDSTYFYIAAEMEEPDLWAIYRDHDSVIFHQNDFEAFFDPDGDTLNYFEFEMNALNTGWDLFLPKPYRKGGKADNGWDIPGLQTAVAIDGTLNEPRDRDRGWTLEIAIPWTSFTERSGKGRPNPGDEWRINFSRVEWQVDIVQGKYVKRPGLKEDNWVWSQQGAINMHIPEQWGYVRFRQ